MVGRSDGDCQAIPDARQGPLARRPGRETRAEIEEEGWHQQQRPDVEPVNQSVEDVELACRAQRIHRQRGEAKGIEPGSRGMLLATLVDQEADQRVGPAENQEKAGHRSAAGALANHDREAVELPVPLDLVLRAGPSPRLGQEPGRVEGRADTPPTDRNQDVARPHSHQCGRTVGLDPRSRDPGFRVRPHDPVLRHPEATALCPVGKRDCSQHHQDDGAHYRPLR